MQAAALTFVFMWACLHQLPLPATPEPITCQNGGTFDNVFYTCTCTPQAYGRQCENLLSAVSLCQSNSSVRRISDATGGHRVGNTALCTGADSCTDFSAIAESWYRFESPAGNYLIADTPCRHGLAGDTGTYCGSSHPFTLRQLVLQLDANDTKLYSAKAYRYDTAYATCFNPDNMYYPVRILVCPDNSTVYYIGPTVSSRQAYCIGDASIGSSTATVELGTTDGSAAVTTEAPATDNGLTAATGDVLATPATDDGLTTPTDDGLTTAPTDDGLTTTEASALTTSNGSDVITTAEPVSVVTTESAGDKNVSHTAGWNLLANDSHPCLPVVAIESGTVQHLSCSIKTNSLQAKLGLAVAPAVVQSSGSVACCNVTHVLRWLAESNRIYVNCVVDVLNSTGHSVTSSEVTVCRDAISNRPVRYLTNRGQCEVEAATAEALPAFWYQWFGFGTG